MNSMKKKFAALAAVSLLAFSAIAAMNFVRDAGQVRYTNAGAAISAGDVVALGNRHGISLSDVASNATGIVVTEGVFDLTLATNNTVTLDAALYYDTSEVNVTTNTSGNSYIGLAAEAKTTTTATTIIQVDLNANDAY